MRFIFASFLLFVAGSASAKIICSTDRNADLSTVQQAPYAQWCDGGSPVVEGHYQPGTVALRRFYSAQINQNYYTIPGYSNPAFYPSDWTLMEPLGQDGFVYWPKPKGFATVAIYNWNNPYTNEFRLSTYSPGAEWTKLNNLNGGAVGYVPVSQPPTYTPYADGTTWTAAGSSFRMLRRCKQADKTSCGTTSAGNEFVVSGATHRAVSKSAGQNTHNLSWTFTNDASFFNTGANTTHLTSGVRANLTNGMFSGVIVAVGRFGELSNGVRCVDNQVRVIVEAYFKTSNGSYRGIVDGASCSTPLQNGKKYRIDVKSMDTGYTQYSVVDTTTGVTVYTYTRTDIRPMFTEGTTNYFPMGTSYRNMFIAPVWDQATEELSMPIEGITSSWTAE